MRRFIPFLPLLLLLALSACASREAVPQETIIAGESVVLPENMKQGYVQTIPVGEISVLGIVDSPHVFEAREIREFDKYPDARQAMPNGKFQAVVKTYLVKSGNKLVLVDSGWGIEQGRNGRTLEILEKQGIKPGDVTDVILTHMDIDHLGGLVRKSKAVYPNAKVHVSRPELAAWKAGNVSRSAPEIAKDHEMLNAYGGRVVAFDFDEEILPGIKARSATGHTPGHTVYDVTSGNDGLTIVGDMLHVWPIQMRHPDISTIYDTVPQAAEAREKTFARIAAENRKIAGMHFPQVGKLRKARQGGYEVMAD